MKINVKKRLQDCKILIIDDNEVERMVLRKILTKNHFVHIEEAVDGEDGLEKIIALKPDCIFLDIHMPKMDGIGVCNAMKEQQIHHEVVTIILTVEEDFEVKAQAFNAGAADFISKPLNEKEVLPRLTAHMERKLYQRIIEDDYQRIQEELREAKVLQNILLPEPMTLEAIKNAQELDIAEYYLPSSELGGDYLAVRKLSDTKTMLLTADITGHGVTAALYTFMLHTILQETISHDTPPGTLLEMINNKLHKLLPPNKFITLFLGIIDTEKGVLDYAAAASPPPLLFSNGYFRPLDTKGLPLSVIENPTYQTHTHLFHPGDALLIYSDAWIEIPDSQGQTLSEEALGSFILDRITAPAGEILQNVTHMFFERYGKAVPDDLSCIICKHP